MLLNRINKEYAEFISTNLDKYDIKIERKSNIYWESEIKGPPDTPYENTTFKLSIKFPESYPFTPPKIIFITKIYHPNIDHNGIICLDILKDNWAPVYSIIEVLKMIINLIKNPNPNDPLCPEAAKLYLTDRNEYNKRVLDMIKLYA